MRDRAPFPRFFAVLLVSMGMGLGLGAARAAPPPKKAEVKAAAPARLDFPVQKATLENGLRVVLSVDHGARAVAVAITYDAGIRDEGPAQNGFARSIERLMFGATKNLADGEYASLVAGRGGSFGATTAIDHSSFSLLVPENELALALWLEAERMRSLDLSRPDLGALRAWHAAHYGPNTAVLAISGDFDPDAAMSLVHRYFDEVPRIAAIPFVAPAGLAHADGRREVMEDSRAAAPSLSLRYATPNRKELEHLALRFAAIVLQGGAAARLPALLMGKDALATGARVEMETSDVRGPGLFRVEIQVAPSASAADVEKKVDAALDALAKSPPTEAEMKRAKARLWATTMASLAPYRTRAEALGVFELCLGDARQINRELERIDAVRAEDVKKAVAGYLLKSRRTTIETRPPAFGGGATTAEKL